MSNTFWLDDASSFRLALTLMHFLWQGLAIAGVAGCAMFALRKKTAQVRYALTLSAMILMAACPAMTFLMVDLPNTESSTMVADADESAIPLTKPDELLATVPPAVTGAEEAWQAPLVSEGPVQPTELHQDSATRPAEISLGLERWRSAAPYVIAAYVVGVLVLLGR